MTIRFEENVSIENAQFVCQWSNSLGKSFQEQWMGPKIPFPLEIQVLQDLEGIFSIFDGPEFVGLSPYEQIPFQFSIHKEDGKGNLEHFEFLADVGADPRYELALNLIKFIPQDACVLAYNMSFEKGVIRRLAANYPQISSELMAIHDNIKDLMAPFASKSYYHPKMQGSYSIKYVLPALVPEFESAYKDLNLIHHGGEAMQAYENMTRMSANDREAYKKALLAYCKLDTLAMIKVLEKLREIVH